MKRRTAVALGVCVVAIIGLSNAKIARADTIPSGGWVSTQTVPDYILADDGPTVAYTSGSVKFSAAWNPRFGVEWQDTYLVTGYSHGANSTSQAGSYGKYVYKMPLRVNSSSQFTGKMTYSTSDDFDGRPGWDIWLSPSGSQDVDTSAASLEANPRTVEILLQPGTVSFESNPGYDRLFYGVGSLADVNIGAYVQKALAYLGLRPSDYYWAAVDGGVEMTRGSFIMDSYSLSVTTDATVGGKTVKIPDWGATPIATSAPVKNVKNVKTKIVTGSGKKLATVKNTTGPVVASVQPTSSSSDLTYAVAGIGGLAAIGLGLLLWRLVRRSS